MWEFDHKVWALKNWCFWVVVLEKTLKSPWTAWRSKPSILKEINPEYSLEDCCWSSNTLAMWCEEPAYWKRSWCWEDWGQEEKMVTEDEILGWLHWLNEHEFEQTLGDSEGQGSLVCCSPWGCKESDMTEQLNNKQLLFISSLLAGEIIGVTIPQFFYLSSTDSLFYKLRFPYTHLCGNYFEIHRGRISKVNQLISKATSKNW